MKSSRWVVSAVPMALSILHGCTNPTANQWDRKAVFSDSQKAAVSSSARHCVLVDTTAPSDKTVASFLIKEAVEQEKWYVDFVGGLSPREMFGFVCSVDHAEVVALGVRRGMQKASVSGRIYVQLEDGVWLDPFSDS